MKGCKAFLNWVSQNVSARNCVASRKLSVFNDLLCFTKTMANSEVQFSDIQPPLFSTSNDEGQPASTPQMEPVTSISMDGEDTTTNTTTNDNNETITCTSCYSVNSKTITICINCGVELPHATPNKDAEERNTCDDCFEPADGGCFYNGKRDRICSAIFILSGMAFNIWAMVSNNTGYLGSDDNGVHCTLNGVYDSNLNTLIPYGDMCGLEEYTTFINGTYGATTFNYGFDKTDFCDSSIGVWSLMIFTGIAVVFGILSLVIQVLGHIRTAYLFGGVAGLIGIPGVVLCTQFTGCWNIGDSVGFAITAIVFTTVFGAGCCVVPIRLALCLLFALSGR